MQVPSAPLELHAALVGQAADAIIFADREGFIRIWNGGAERIFGYAASEAVGQSLDLIIPEHLRGAHWDGFRHAILTGTTKYDGRTLTTRSTSKGGRKQYVELSFALVRDAAGAIVGSVAIGRDGAERHAAERALRERVGALEKALETASRSVKR